MPWPFRPKRPTQACFPIGQYKLGAQISGLTGLVEFSQEEYAAIGRQFKREINYNAPHAQFLGLPWKVSLQTINGSITKIAPFILFTSKQEANPVATSVLHYCSEQFGRPSELRIGLFIWDTTDGNVVLQTGECMEGLAINLFLTSNLLRTFERL